MSALAEIPGIEAFVRDRIEQQKKCHGEVSAELQHLNPGVRGLSCMSVRRYCTQHGIHRTARLTDATVDQIVSFNVGKLDVTTVWLKDEFGPKAFFPNSDNSDFFLTNDVGVSILSFVVNGVASQRISTNASSSRPSNVVNPSVGTIAYKPIFTAKKNHSVSVKIVQAKVTKSATGKLEFEKLGQAFIDVNETTANVYYISGVAQRKWGDEYILVTGDGLKLEDSSGTQGLKFWRIGSRKIFAVAEFELERVDKGKGKRKRKEIIQIEDSDSDEIAEKKLKREDELMTEVKAIRHDLGAVLALSKNMKLPPGLLKQLMDTFKCRICHSTPMSHPIIFTRCCKSILGCEVCVDAWFGGEEGRSKSCPLCRADRAYSETCRLHGLDDFLTAIRPLLCDESSENSDPQPSTASQYRPSVRISPTPNSDDDFE